MDTLTLIGKIMISCILAITAVGLVIQEWNKTHVYNPDWPPHARFHTVTGIVMNLCFSLSGFYLLWFMEGIAPVFLAAMTPVYCWVSFFVAAMVRGSKVEDVAGQVPRVWGIPINMLFPGVFILLALLGLMLYLLS